MSTGSTKDYRFGQKNHWRRTLWNEILKRTDGREASELILYLAGPQDLDRLVATQKGVPSRNLVALDRSLKNVHLVRTHGQPALHGDALAILRSWPDSTKICAVVLDFCCGLINQEWMSQISQVMLRNPLRDAILAANFLRGRDAESEPVRQEARKMYEFLVENVKGSQVIESLESKHRGFAFAWWHALIHCTDVDRLRTSCAEANVNMDWIAPKFFSYKSGCLVFDSVVMSPVARRFELSDKRISEVADLIQERYPKDRHLALRISAMLAVRTRRATA